MTWTINITGHELDHEREVEPKEKALADHVEAFIKKLRSEGFNPISGSFGGSRHQRALPIPPHASQTP